MKMKLSQYQSLWDRALSGGEDLSGLASELGVDTDRLGIYQEFVQDHYLGALDKMYPRLLEWVETDRWERWSQEYYSRWEPKAWEINELAKHFPQYLSEKVNEEKCPLYWAELARYEWAEFETYLHPAEERKLAKQLMLGEVALNPTISVMRFEYDMAHWVAQNDEGGSGVSKPRKKPTLLIISRHPETGQCVFTQPSLLAIQLIEEMSDKNEVDEQVLIEAVMGQGVEKERAVREELGFMKRQGLVLISSIG